MKGTRKFRRAETRCAGHMIADDIPEPTCDQPRGWQQEVVSSELFSSERVESSVTDHRGFDLNGAEEEVSRANGSFGIGGEDADVGHRSGLGVLAAVMWFDDRDMIVDVEFGDPPRRPLMQIDRTRVDKSKGA